MTQARLDELEALGSLQADVAARLCGTRASVVASGARDAACLGLFELVPAIVRALDGVPAWRERTAQATVDPAGPLAEERKRLEALPRSLLEALVELEATVDATWLLSWWERRAASAGVELPVVLLAASDRTKHAQLLHRIVDDAATADSIWLIAAHSIRGTHRFVLDDDHRWLARWLGRHARQTLVLHSVEPRTSRAQGADPAVPIGARCVAGGPHPVFVVRTAEGRLELCPRDRLDTVRGIGRGHLALDLLASMGAYGRLRSDAFCGVTHRFLDRSEPDVLETAIEDHLGRQRAEWRRLVQRLVDDDLLGSRLEVPDEIPIEVVRIETDDSREPSKPGSSSASGTSPAPPARSRRLDPVEDDRCAALDAEIRELLSQSAPSAIARGAWHAARHRRNSVVPELLAALQRVNEHVATFERWAADLPLEQLGSIYAGWSLLDALIELEVAVDPTFLEPWWNRRRDAIGAVIALASLDARANVPALLACVDEEFRTSEWTAFCNLLVAAKSAHAVAPLLRSLEIPITISKTGEEHRAIGCGSDEFPCDESSPGKGRFTVSASTAYYSDRCDDALATVGLLLDLPRDLVELRPLERWVVRTSAQRSFEERLAEIKNGHLARWQRLLDAVVERGALTKEDAAALPDPFRWKLER